MQSNEANASWIWTFKKLKFVKCFTHKSMMINHKEKHTEVSSKVFKLSNITRLKEEIEMWNYIISS